MPTEAPIRIFDSMKKKSSSKSQAFGKPPKPISKNAAYTSLGEASRTGRKPKKLKTLDERLAQVEKECESFSRLIRECWCDPGSPLIRDAVGATELDNVVDLYDDAIVEMQAVKRLSEVATEILLEGRSEAIRKRIEIIKKRSKSRKKNS